MEETKTSMIQKPEKAFKDNQRTDTKSENTFLRGADETFENALDENEDFIVTLNTNAKENERGFVESHAEQAQSEENTIVIKSESEDAKYTWKEESVNTQHEAELQIYGDSSSNINTPVLNGEKVDKSEEQNCNQPERDNEPSASKDKTVNIEQIVIERTDKRGNITEIIHGKHDIPQNKNTEDRFKVDSVREKNLSLGIEIVGPGYGCEIAAIEHAKGNTQMDSTQEGEKTKSIVGSVSQTIVTGREQEAGYITISNSGNAKGTFETDYLSDIILKRERAEHPTEEKLATRNELAHISVGNSGTGNGITKDVFQGDNKVQDAAISNAEKAEHETSKELTFRTEYADSTNEENCVSGNENPNRLFQDDDKAQNGLPDSFCGYQYERNKIRTHFNTIPVNVDFRNNNRAVVSEVDRDIHRTKKESDRQKPPYDNYEKIDRFETTDIKRSDETSGHFADSKTGIVQNNSGDNASNVFEYQQSNIITKTETINECENIVIDLDRIELPEEKPFVRPEEENIQSSALPNSTEKVEHERQEGNLFSVDTQKTETLQNMLSKDGADVYSTEFADDGVAENQNDDLPAENIYLDETLLQDTHVDIQVNSLAETSNQVKTSSPTSDKSTDTSIDTVLDPNNGGFFRERHVRDRLGKSPIRKVAIPDIVNNKKDYFECHFIEADDIKRDVSDGFKEMLDSSQRKYSHNGNTEKENKSDSDGDGKKIYTGVNSTEEKQLSEQKVANTQIGHSNLLPENERSPKLDNSCNRSENRLTFPSQTASNAIREDLDVQSFEIREESKSKFSEEQSNPYSDTHFPTQKQLHNDVEAYTENVSSEKGFPEPTVEEAVSGFYSSHEDLFQEMRQDNPNEHYQSENVLTGQKDLIDHNYEDSNGIKVASQTDTVITEPSDNIEKNTSQTYVNSKEGDDQASHLIQDVYFHRDDTDLHITKGIEPRKICDKLPLENQARDISKQDHKSDVCSSEIRVSAQDVRVGVMKDSCPNEARDIPTAIIEAQNSEVQLRAREIDKKNYGKKIDESERKLDYSSETNPNQGMDTRDGESAVDNSEIITDESSRCLPVEFTEVPDQKKVRQSENMYMAGNEVIDVKVTHENENGAGISTNSSADRKNEKENGIASSEYEHKEVPSGYKEPFKSDNCATTKQDAEMENASDNKSEDVQFSENDKHEESPMSKKDMQSTMVKLDTNDERSTIDTAAAEDICSDDDSSGLKVKSGELLEVHNSSLQQKDRSDIEMDSTQNSARLNMTSTSRPKNKEWRVSTEDTEIAADEMHKHFRQSRACNVRVKIEENKGDTKKGTPSQKEISDSAVEKETNVGSSESDTNSQNLRNDSKGRNIDAENSNEIDEEMEQYETHSSNENAIYVHSFNALFKQKKTPDEMQTTVGCLSKVENEELESTGASEFNNKMEIISNESKNDQQDIQCNSRFEKQQIDLSEDEDSGSKKTLVTLIPDLNYALISEESPTEQSSGSGQKSSLSHEKEHQITHEDIGDGELEMKQYDSNPVAGKHNEELNDLSSTEKNSSDVSTDAYRATGYKHKPCTEEIVATTMSSMDEMKSGSDDDTSKTDINSAQDDIANQGNVYFGRKQPYSINMNDERERDNLEFQVHQKDTSNGKSEVDAKASQDALKKPNLDEYIRFEDNEDQEMHLVQNKDILTKSDKRVRVKEDEKVFTPGSKDESENMVDDIFDLQQSKKMCEVKYENTDRREDSKSTNILEKNINKEETRRNASIESTETTREADIEHKEEIHPESLQALVQANESTVYSDTAVSIFVQDIICNAIKNLQKIHNGEVEDEVSASESRVNTPNTDNKGTNNRIHPDFKPMENDDNNISEETKVQQEEMNSDGETQLHALNSDPVDSLSSKDDPTRCIDDGTKPYLVFVQNMKQEDKTNEKKKSGVDETKQKLKEGKELDDTAVNSAADIICFYSSKNGSATKKMKAEVKSESQLLDKPDYLDERIENIGKDTVSKESQIEDKVGMINSETVEYSDAVSKTKELDEEDVHIYGSVETLTNKEPPKDILVAANREDIVDNEVHVLSLEYVSDINGAKEKAETKIQHTTQAGSQSTDKNMDLLQLNIEDSASVGEGTGQDFAPEAEQTEDSYKVDTRVVEGIGENIKVSTKNNKKNNYIQCMSPDDFQTIDETQNELQLDMKNRIYFVKSTNPDASHAIKSNATSEEDDERMTNISKEETHFSSQADSTKNKSQYLAQDEYTSTKETMADVKLCTQTISSDVETTKQNFSPKAKNRIYLEKDGTKLIEGAGDKIELSTKSDNEERVTQIKTQVDSQDMYETADNATKQDASVKIENMDPSRQDELTKTDGLSEEIQLPLLDDNDESKIENMTLNDFKSIGKATDELHLGIRNDTTNFKTTKQDVLLKEENINTSGQGNASVTDGITTDVWILGNENYDENGIKFVLECNFKNIDEGEVQSDVRDSASTVKQTKHDVCPEAKFEETVSKIKQDAPLGLQDEAEDVIKTEVDISSEEIDSTKPSESSIHGQDLTKDHEGKPGEIPSEGSSLLSHTDTYSALEIQTENLTDHGQDFFTIGDGIKGLEGITKEAQEKELESATEKKVITSTKEEADSSSDKTQDFNPKPNVENDSLHETTREDVSKITMVYSNEKELETTDSITKLETASFNEISTDIYPVTQTHSQYVHETTQEPCFDDNMDSTLHKFESLIKDVIKAANNSCANFHSTTHASSKGVHEENKYYSLLSENEEPDGDFIDDHSKVEGNKRNAESYEQEKNRDMHDRNGETTTESVDYHMYTNASSEKPREAYKDKLNSTGHISADYETTKTYIVQDVEMRAEEQHMKDFSVEIEDLSESEQENARNLDENIPPGYNRMVRELLSADESNVNPDAAERDDTRIEDGGIKHQNEYSENFSSTDKEKHPNGNQKANKSEIDDSGESTDDAADLEPINNAKPDYVQKLTERLLEDTDSKVAKVKASYTISISGDNFSRDGEKMPATNEKNKNKYEPDENNQYTAGNSAEIIAETRYLYSRETEVEDIIHIAQDKVSSDAEISNLHIKKETKDDDKSMTDAGLSAVEKSESIEIMKKEIDFATNNYSETPSESNKEFYHTIEDGTSTIKGVTLNIESTMRTNTDTLTKDNENQIMSSTSDDDYCQAPVDQQNTDTTVEELQSTAQIDKRCHNKKDGKTKEETELFDLSKEAVWDDLQTHAETENLSHIVETIGIVTENADNHEEVKYVDVTVDQSSTERTQDNWSLVQAETISNNKTTENKTSEEIDDVNNLGDTTDEHAVGYKKAKSFVRHYLQTNGPKDQEIERKEEDNTKYVESETGSQSSNNTNDNDNNPQAGNEMKETSHAIQNDSVVEKDEYVDVQEKPAPSTLNDDNGKAGETIQAHTATSDDKMNTSNRKSLNPNTSNFPCISVEATKELHLPDEQIQVKDEVAKDKEGTISMEIKSAVEEKTNIEQSSHKGRYPLQKYSEMVDETRDKRDIKTHNDDKDLTLKKSAAVFEEETFPSLNENHDIDEHMGQKKSTEKSQFSHVATEDLCMASEHDINNVANVTKELSQLTQDKAFDQTLKVSDTSRQDTCLSPDAEEDVNFYVDPDIDKLFQASIHTIQEHDEIMKGISSSIQGNIETVKETTGYVKFFEAGLVKVVSEPIQDLNAKAEETTDSGQHTLENTNSMILYNLCNELRERPSSAENDNDRNVDVEGESFNLKTLSSYQHIEGNVTFAPLESTKQAENGAQDAEEEITDDKPEANAGSKSTCEQKASRKVNNGGDVQMGGDSKPIIENDLETIGEKKKNKYLDEENLKLSDPEGEEITTSSIDIQHTDTTSYNTIGKSEAEHSNNNDRTNGTTSSTSVFRNDDSPGAKYDSNSIDEDTQKQQALTKEYIGVSVQEAGDSYHIFENDRDSVTKTTEKLQLTTEFLPLSHKNSKSTEEDDEHNFAENNIEKAHDADNDQLYSEERFLLQKSEKIVESGNLEKQHETNNGNDSRIVENPYPMLFNTGNEGHNDTHDKQFAREPHLVTHDASQAAIKSAGETELNSNYAANDRDEDLNRASLYSSSSIDNTTETNIHFPISGEFYLTEQDEMLVEIGKRTPEKMENNVNAEENRYVPSTEEFSYKTDHNKISIKTTQETAQADREIDSIYKDDTKRSDKGTHQNDPDVKGKREDITETAIHIISTNDKLSKEVSYEVHDDSTFKLHGNVNVITPEQPAENKDEVIVTSENAAEIMSKIPRRWNEISDENSEFQVETNLQNVDEATTQRLQDQMQIETAHDVHSCKEFGGFAETVTTSAEQTWKEVDITNKNRDIMDKKTVDAYHSKTQVVTEMTPTLLTIHIDTSEHLIYETVKSASNYKNESQYSSEDFVHLEKNHHVYNTNSKAKAVEIPISELRKYDSPKPELNALCISDNLQIDESQSANNLEIDNTLSVSKQQEGNANVPYVTVDKELLSDTEKPIHGISHKSNSEIAINSIDYVDSSQAKSNHSVNNARQSVTPHEEIESLGITKYAELESGQIFDPRENVLVYVNGDLSYKVPHEEEIERQPKTHIIPDTTKLLSGVQSTKSKTKETDVEYDKDVHYIENGEQGTRNNHNLDERRVRDTNILSHDEFLSVKECKGIFDYSSECRDNSEQTLISLERSTFTEHPQNESESESIVHNMITNVAEMEVMKSKKSMNMTVPDTEESETVEKKEARYFPYLSAVSRIVDRCSLGIRTNDPLKSLIVKSSNKIQDEPVPSLSKNPGTEHPRNLSVQNRSVEQADSKVSNEVLAKSEVIGSRCDISERYIGKSNNVDGVDNTETKENKSDSAVERQVQMSEKGHGKSSIDSDKSIDENELHDGETVFRNTQNNVSEKEREMSETEMQIQKSSENKDKDNNTTDDIGIKILDGNVRFVEDTFSKPSRTFQGKENQQTSENIEDVDSEDFSRKREAKDENEEKNDAKRMLLEDDIDYRKTHLKLSKQDTECIKLEEVPSNKEAQMLHVSHAIEEGNVTEDNIASEIGNDYLRKAVLHPLENGAPIILQDNGRSENDDKFEKSKDESTKGTLNDHALTYKEVPISKNKKDESSRPAPTKLLSLVKELKKTLVEETEMQLQYMGSLKSVREDIKRGLEAFKSIQCDERSSREYNDSDSEYSTDTHVIYHESEDSHSINQEEDFSEFWNSLDDDEFGLSRNHDRTVAEKDTQTEEKRLGVANDSEVLESGEQEKNNIPTRSKDEAEGGDADKQMEMNEEEEKEQRREKQELSDIIADRDENEMLDLKLIKKIKPSEKNSTEATILPSGNESTVSEKDTKASFRPGTRKYTDPNIPKYHAPKGNPKIDSKWSSDHPAYQMLYRRQLTPGKLNFGTRLHVKRRNVNDRGQPPSPIKAIHSMQRNGAIFLPPIHHPSHPEIREDIFKTKQYLEYLHKHPIQVRPRKSDKTTIPLGNRQGEYISLSLPNLSEKLLLSPLQLHQELLFDPHPPTCPRKPFSAKELAEMEEYLELIQIKPDSPGRSSSSNQVDLSHNRPIEDLVEIIQVRKKFYLGNREEKEDYREHRIHQIFRELQQIRKKSEEAKDILIIRKSMRFRSGRKDSENTKLIILDYSHGEVEKMKTDEDLRKFLCEPLEYELCAKGRPLYRNKRRQRAYSELKDKLNKKTRPRYDRLY